MTDLAHVHIKNARWFPVRYLDDKTVIWKCDWTAVHKGIADMRALVKTLRTIGYDGWTSFEDSASERPLEYRRGDNLALMKKSWLRPQRPKPGQARDRSRPRDDAPHPARI